MSQIIKDYYCKAKVDERLINKKLEIFNRNKDIEKEFEYWIENRSYKENGVEIEGYTANKIAKISRFIDGEGAFVLLIKLREKPSEALKAIKEGFKMK